MLLKIFMINMSFYLQSDREDNLTSTEDETTQSRQLPTKNLRFFGDTDIESNDSLRQKPSSRSRPGFSNDRIRSQSTRELHNICEERRTPDLNTQRHNGHKSMLNISESSRDGTLKPPISPSHRSRDVPSRSSREERLRRRKNEMSSVESSEGDSSQQSQRSVVYLHAATG